MGLKNDDERAREEATEMAEAPMIQRVRQLIDPIASDLDLDVYDVEQRGATLRVTLDTRPGSPASVDLEQLSLATRLISRELDHADPVPGRYTLEVTSPGVERNLRTPAHFQREIGKRVNVRLANVEADQRRLEGVLVAADERTATIRVDAGEPVDHVIDIASIDRARTVFVWGPQPKPGQTKSGRSGSRKQPAAAKGISQPMPSASMPRQSVEEPS